jgi:TonB-dependent starch-binding outer membrane protein SusC
MKQLISICLILFFGLQFSIAQTTVTGKVLSSDGTALSGVTVKLQGKMVTVSTGADGTYSISVPAGVTALEVVLEGYKPSTQVIGGKKTIDFVLTKMTKKELKKYNKEQKKKNKKKNKH